MSQLSRSNWVLNVMRTSLFVKYTAIVLSYAILSILKYDNTFTIHLPYETCILLLFSKRQIINLLVKRKWNAIYSYSKYNILMKSQKNSVLILFYVYNYIIFGKMQLSNNDFFFEKKSNVNGFFCRYGHANIALFDNFQ